MRSLVKVKYLKYSLIGIVAGMIIGGMIYWILRSIRDEKDVEFVDY